MTPLFATNSNDIENTAKEAIHRFVQAEVAHLVTVEQVQEDFSHYDDLTKQFLREQLQKYNIHPSDPLIQIAFNELHAYCKRLSQRREEH